jgi:hypothetical protein
MGWIEIIGVVGALAAAVLSFLQSRQNKGKIQEVRVIVNHTRDVMVARNRLLAATLRENHIDVPPDIESEFPD